MILALPLFFLFAIYGLVSVYLPLILTDLGYSATQAGFLLGIFEGAGVILPLAISPIIERGRRYGVPLLLMGLIMMVVPFPLVHLRGVSLLHLSGFGATAFFLSLYSIGYKGAVPVSDSLTNRVLAHRRDDYGKVRVAGSVGYVIMTLLLQSFVPAGKSSDYLVWWVVSAGLFTLSLLLIPGIFSREPKQKDEERVFQEEKKKESLKEVFAQFPKIFWMGLLLLFLGFFGLTPPMKLFSLFVRDFLHSNASGILSAISAGAEIPFMFFSGLFIRRYGSFKILLFCTAMVTVRLLIYIIIPNMVGAILGQLLHSVTYGLYHPVAVVFVAQYAPREKLVVSMSLYSILAIGLASVLGTSLGGWMIDSFGFTTLFVVFALFPLLGVLFYYFIRKKKWLQPL